MVNEMVEEEETLVVILIGRHQASEVEVKDYRADVSPLQTRLKVSRLRDHHP
jgi:hypothetical protein